MALIVGVFLALAVGAFATIVGLDRDRGFYPTVMIVIAFYYVLFAVMGGSSQPLVVESLVAAGFIVLAVVGLRSSLWAVALALAAHGVFDLAHPAVIANPGVPPWWREFCFAYDLVAAGYLAWLLKTGRTRAAPTRPFAPALRPRQRVP